MLRDHHHEYLEVQGEVAGEESRSREKNNNLGEKERKGGRTGKKKKKNSSYGNARERCNERKRGGI